MRRTRRMMRSIKRWVARTLIGVMVFAQLAIAAHACPAVAEAVESGSVSFSATGTASEDAPAPALDNSAGRAAMDCDDMPAPMDADAPNLCAQHCQYGQQSDQAYTVTVPAALLTSLYIVAPRPTAAKTRPSADVPVDLFAATSPPHAILHCCLRD